VKKKKFGVVFEKFGKTIEEGISLPTRQRIACF